MDNFLETGKYDPKGEMEEYKNFEYFELPRRYYSLINICCWAAVILLPALYFLIKMLTSGSLLNVFLATAFMALGENYWLNIESLLELFLN